MCNVVIGFGIHMKLVRLRKLCLTETWNRFGVRKICLKYFLLKWSEKKEIIYRH